MNLHDWIDELCDTLELGDAEVDELAEQVERLAASWDRPSSGEVRADDPPADEGGSDFTGALDLGAGDSDDADGDADDDAGAGFEDRDLAEVG